MRLWEIDVRVALESGQAGPLALVPLLRGGDEPDKLLTAVRMLDALPRSESTDAMATLLDLAGQRYDRATFENVLGKDRVMQSWLWQLGRDEGEAKALRLVCANLARELHPRVAARVLPAIESCDRPETLHEWILQCPKLSGAGFAALVTGQARGQVTLSRTSRPSRRAGRRPPARPRR